MALIALLADLSRRGMPDPYRLTELCGSLHERNTSRKRARSVSLYTFSSDSYYLSQDFLLMLSFVIRFLGLS